MFVCVCVFVCAYTHIYSYIFTYICIYVYTWGKTQLLCEVENVTVPWTYI